MSIGALTPNYTNPTPPRSEQAAPASVSTPAQARVQEQAQDQAQDKTTPAANASATTKLSPEALAQIDKLKSRDLEVRQHEQAHMAAAGGLAVSGASYTYQRGPNGVDYAVGGEVNIDTSPGATPEETIQKARTIQTAALAPAEPSGPDRAVAAQAQQMETKARSELAQQQAQNAYGAKPARAPTLDVYA